MTRHLKTVLLGANVASAKYLLKTDTKGFLDACYRSLNSARPAVEELAEIPVVDLEDILEGKDPMIRLVVAKGSDGSLPRNQAIALLSILVAEQPKEVLEIGTFMGTTTRHLAENLPDATIHTVDLPEDFDPGDAAKINVDDIHLVGKRTVGRDYLGTSVEGRIKQHFGDTATWDFSQAGNPTFFWIDGAHTYEYCKQDSEKCFELCGGRGVFLWHDCNTRHPGVPKFVMEWRAMGRDIRRINGTPICYWKSI